MAGLRTSLQEDALTIADAARKLSNTVEAERWQALAELEKRVERKLSQWGFTSRSTRLAKMRVIAPPGMRRIIFAGVPDFPGAVKKWLTNSPLPATILVGAPASEEAMFDELGRPRPKEIKNKENENRELIGYWNERSIAWPDEGRGGVTLTADPRQQASEALRLAAAAATPSDQLALGSADEQTAGELVRSFGRAGWTLHDPSHLPPSPLSTWLSAWRAYLSAPGAASAIDLLGLSQSGALTGGRRAQRVEALSSARDKWLARDKVDLSAAKSLTTRKSELEKLELAAETLEKLERSRVTFLREGFHRGMKRLMEIIDPTGKHSREVFAWLDSTAALRERIDREPGFWIDVLRATLPEPIALPPDGRVLDVQGWLELFHEPGPHLIICGMNEGMIPGRASTDAWMPESTRRALDLSSDSSRAARDAYLLTAMIQARRSSGRVDLLLAKAGAGGEALLPSRLLLAAEDEELPARVTSLFREIEPPDSSLAWTLDEAWKWRPAPQVKEARINVTGFSDYLTCPFRFYLKHVAQMAEPEPERVEWNARDFGNIAHIVLERWALDDEAKEYSKSEALEAWVHDSLDQVIEERFGKKVPLAVRIQRESLRQRLSWFARVQAVERVNGWRIEEVEKRFELEIDGVTVVGRVDRIDRHEDGRRRVLDYKTGASGSAVEIAHRSGVVATTKLPQHLENIPAILCTSADGKPKRWKNLQVPLYSAALADVDELGYFSLGATESEVKLSLWEDFSRADRESAMECAKWVISQVRERVFWPPAEKADYDDYVALGLGRGLNETIIWQGGVA